MSDKNNSNGREYTVDDILAEYDTKDKTAAAEESPEPGKITADVESDTEAVQTEEASVNTENKASEEDVSMYDIDDGYAEGFDPDEALEEYRIKTEPVIDVAPAMKFTSEIKAVDLSEAFGEQAANLVDAILGNTDEIVIMEESDAEIADEDDDASEAEELEEIEADEDEIGEDYSDDDPDVIYEDGYEEADDLEEAAVVTFDDGISDDNTIDDEAEAVIEAAEEERSEDAENTDDTAEVTEAVKEEKTAEQTETPADEEKKPFWQGIIPWKGDSAFEVVRKIIFIVAVAVFVGAGIMLADTLIDSNKAVKDTAANESVIATTVATTVDSEGNIVTIAPTEDEIIEHNLDVMKFYKEISEDVIGYIELEGCDIYQPVVQGEDNDYYLTRTYYDEENKAGAIFADYRCVFEEDYTSPNVVLYGHNQEDGTMFGNLKNYKQNLEFYAANPTVTFNTEYGVGTYLIYGFFVTNALAKQDSNGEVFHYHDYIEAMKNEATFDWYMEEVQERNQIISPVDVEFGDQLLCLSTCSNEFSNSRFVVFARKLRDGESVSDYDFTEAYFNPDARGVDWKAILSGETTTTTTAETSEEVTEEISDTEETTEVAETTVEVTEEKTEKTSKTKRVDKTKTQYVHTFTTPGDNTESEQVTDSEGAVVTDEEGNAVTEAPVTDENGETVTEVPETAEGETTTETAGVTE